MRKILTTGIAAVLLVALMLVPGMALAHKGHHKHQCPRSARADRNHDGIPDRWECRHNLSLKVNQANKDPDHDGLNNRGEFEAGDDPNNPDSDHDGVKDGQEHAGTIASFDASTGTLTINVAGGGTVSGKVTNQTEIECKNDGEHGDAHASVRHQDGSDEAKPGDSPGNEHPEANDDQAGCGTDALKPGTAVDEAELKATSTGAVFEKVELDA